MGAAEDAVAALGGIGDELAREFRRPVHAARLEQIGAHAANLAGLISELPAEEEREADYERRLLALHDAGKFDPHHSGPWTAEDRSHPANYSHDARERLLGALAAREGK